MSKDDTAITALQHIAAGHDSFCTACGWSGDRKEARGEIMYECPQCDKGWAAFKVGAHEIAAYALRQIETGDTK